MNESNMPEWWSEQDQDEAWLAQQEKELEQYEAECDDPVIFPEFQKALIGFGEQFSQKVAIYDYTRCLEILAKRGMTYPEAIEYMDFNVLGAYMGRATPVFLTEPRSEVQVKQITEQLELDL